MSDDGTRPCPGCGTLAFMGENTGSCWCATPMPAPPTHEPQTPMFAFPTSIRGQLELDTGEDA